MTFPVVDFVPDGLSWRVIAYHATVDEVLRCLDLFAVSKTDNKDAWANLLLELTGKVTHIPPRTEPPAVANDAPPVAVVNIVSPVPLGPRLVR